VKLLAPEAEQEPTSSLDDVILLYLATFANDSMHAYIYIYNTSRIRGSGRIQYAYHRSSRGKTAVSRMWKKYEISLCKEIHGVSIFNPT